VAKAHNPQKTTAIKKKERERRGEKDRSVEEDRERDKDIERETCEEKKRQEQERKDLEAKWRSDYEAREKRLADERKKAEDEKTRRTKMEKDRKSKLGSAFSLGDDDEDDGDRTAFLRAKAAKSGNVLPASAVTSAIAIATPKGVTGSRETGIDDVRPITPASGSVGADFAAVAGVTPITLAKKLGFDDCEDPAEAFMRLQERKRKGRRAEFGGPPRGSSPWRDGKKGVIFSKDRVV